MKQNKTKKNEKENFVRVSKENKKKVKSSTNWAALLVEEKKEGFRK